jgi:putative peptide maturation system protein
MTAAIISPSLLGDALAYLAGLDGEQASPPAAQCRLHALRAAHPAARLRLVWQREEFDGSHHYDLLISCPARGTVSLSYCPDRALPWPFRGGHRVSERLLLRVNGADMELDHAIACLDFLWDESPLAERLVTACLLREELEADPVELDGDELQGAMDAFRRARGLLAPAATSEWMARRCLSHRDLEDLVATETAVARLRKRKAAGRVEGYFDANRRGLERVRVVELVFTARADAERADTLLEAGAELSALVVGAASGCFRTARRDELSLGGPYPTADGHALTRVLAAEPAVLDEATAEEIERRLFADWLRERRRAARVEWFWGNAARTAAENTTPRTP